MEVLRKSYPADYDKPSFSRTCLETSRNTCPAGVRSTWWEVCVCGGVGWGVGGGVEWASGHTACTYKDHAKNIIEGLRGTKLSILSTYSLQKYFHTLVLLLILQQLIGIFIVKTLFRRAPLLMVMKVEKSALLGKPSICFILKKKKS